jgi:hypothetical protein
MRPRRMGQSYKWEGWGVHNVDQRQLPGSATWEPMFNLPSGFPGLIHANEIQFLDFCFPCKYVAPSCIEPLVINMNVSSACSALVQRRACVCVCVCVSSRGCCAF